MGHAKNKIARVFSLLGNPLISFPLILGIILIEIEGFISGLRILTVILILIVLPISAWLIFKVKSGAYTDSDVSDKGQRVYFYLTVIPILLLSSFVLFIYKQPDYVFKGVLIVTFLIFSCFLVNYFSKISLHVSMNSYLAVSVFVLSPMLSIILLSLTAIIGWSRIYLNRHHRMEVFLGFIAGMLAGIIFLNVQNKSNHPETVQIIISRAIKHNNEDYFRYYSYENAGHEFNKIPNIPQPDFSSFLKWKSGGTPQGNALASISS